MSNHCSIKMARASTEDLEMAMELCNALDSLDGWSPTMPSHATERDDESPEYFHIDDPDQCQRVLIYLIALADRASLMRVVYGCAMMLSPVNELVDPLSDAIEHHPKRLLLEHLLSVAKQTLTENNHLADGEDCTLKALRDAVKQIDEAEVEACAV